MLLTSIIRMYLTRTFKPFYFMGKHTNRLSFENLQNLGLYVHIPFCRSLCSFCPYCKVVYKKETADRYKTALLKEIDLVGQYLQDRKEVSDLYFGGGTPALMADDLADIINKLKQYFDIVGGIGVELHPDDIDEKNLEKLKLAGVTMVSVGIQSFNEDCLNNLGRGDCNFLIDRLKLITKANFDVVDVDLIFGIPGQTDEILIEDVDKAFRYGATQISTYPFIDFTYANNKYKPLSQRSKKRMLQTLVAHCRNVGKDRTSVWTFANLGTKKYSSITRDNFLGFGVSATTLLQDIFKINTFSVEEYIKRIKSEQLPTSLTLEFTGRQRAVYFLFWRAYSMGISPDRFKAVVGVSLKEMFGFEFWALEKLGLIHSEKGQYRLSDKAAYYYHYIEQVYTTAYIDKMWNISRQIAFPNKIVLK